MAQYLTKLTALLGVRSWAYPACRRRFLEDIREQLQDAVDAYIAKGLSPEEAERHAIADLGPAKTLAAEFASYARSARRSLLVRLGPVLLVALAASLMAFRLLPGAGPVPTAPFTAECGSDDRGSKGDSDRDKSSRRDHRIVVAGVWSGEEKDNFTKVLAQFEKNTGAQVTFAFETRNIASALRARVQRGCPPDIALLPQPSLVADLAKRGQIKPIESFAGDLIRANYSPSWYKLGRPGGTLYGVWFKAANKSRIWYRPAAFRNARVQPPRTWRQLTTAATRLWASGVVPFSVAGADGWTLTDWFENVYLRAAGPDRYQRLAEHKIPWTDSSVRRALGRLSEIFAQRQWLAGEPTNTSFERSVRDVFATRPKAAMVYEGDFVASTIANLGEDKVADAQSVEFPSIDGSKPAVVAGGDEAVLFTNNETAKKLIRFLATPRAAEPWAKAGGFLSPNKRLALRTYPDSATRRAAMALQRGAVQFDLSDQQPPAFGLIEGQGMRQILRDFLQHPADINITMQRLDDAVTAAEKCERAVGGQC